MRKETPLDQLKQAASEAEDIDALKNLAEPLAAAAPQETLLDRAASLFRQRLKQARERPPISAELQFDSWNGSLALGVRNGVVTDRQLLFQHGDVDVDLQIVPITGSSHANVQGQIMTEAVDLAGIELRLSEPNGKERGRITDEMGDFIFSYCPAGDYTLTIALESGDLVSQFTINSQSDAAQ